MKHFPAIVAKLRVVWNMWKYHASRIRKEGSFCGEAYSKWRIMKQGEKQNLNTASVQGDLHESRDSHVRRRKNKYRLRMEE